VAVVKTTAVMAAPMLRQGDRRVPTQPTAAHDCTQDDGEPTSAHGAFLMVVELVGILYDVRPSQLL
jgi:hypothetical protein